MGRIIKLVFDIFFVLLALFICICLAYYFGWSLLTGPMNWGNDTPFAASYIKYLDTWFPHIPLWMYSWAGGMSYLIPYPILPSLITFFSHHFSGWTLQQSMRFIYWFSVPLAACGVAVIGRLLTKNWLLGIFAGVLLFFSPDSWLWITQAGFYAFSVSVPVFAWSIVFFILAWQKRKRFFWFLSIVSYALSWIFHPTVGILFTITFVILAVGFALQKRESIRKAILKVVLVISTGAFLSAWWMIPFYFVRQNQGIGSSIEQIVHITFKELVGLTFAHDQVYLTSTMFTASVVILFLIGLVASFLRKSIIRVIAVACLAALAIIMIPPHLPDWINQHLTVFYQATNIRTVLILRILGPVVAAYGASSLLRPIFWAVEKVIRNLKENKVWLALDGITGVAFGFIVFIYLLKNVVVIPPMPENQPWLYVGYGPMYNWLLMDGKGVNSIVYTTEGNTPLFPKLFDVAKTVISGQIKVDPWESGFDKTVKAATALIGLSNKDRIEIPPFSGYISGALISEVDLTEIPSYSGITLIPRMWGWQTGCFYYDERCGPTEVDDLSRWFGIWGIWMGGVGGVNPETDKVMSKIISSSNYEYKKYEFNVDGQPAEWNTYIFKDSTGLASLTNKPVILVIGDNPPNSDVFDTVFRGLSWVNFGYKKAWSVRGKRFVDDYSLEELKKFDVIVLYGYRYHSRNEAWGLLQKYIEEGGSVFVDNGWQYMNDDWGKIEGGNVVPLSMPEVFPVTQTIWGNVGKDWNLVFSDNQITQGVGVEGWARPIYGDNPWGMSLAQDDWLKKDSIPLVSDNGMVLVASRNYGKGKIVWSGFDFWGLFNEGGGKDQKQLVNNILSWLSDKGINLTETKLDFTRVNPDLIKINIDSLYGGNKLLFKEAISRNWQAHLINNGKRQKLTIYPAGPGWKMVFLPNNISNAQLIFSYKLTPLEVLAIVISLLTLLGLFLYLVGLTQKLEFFVGKKFVSDVGNQLERIKKDWEKE